MTKLSASKQIQSSQLAYDILLIEDDEATGEMLTECVETECSFHVRSLSSGEEVLQHLQENSELTPSLFIIDYLLPGMNGLQLLDHLQSVESLKRVPAILITAAIITDDMQTSLQDRNITLLPKPLDLNFLIDYLEYIRNNAFQQLI